MKKPIWHGKARRISPGTFKALAFDLGCETAVVLALWKVESAGRGFRNDGSLERRFEPHKMPGASTNWRDSAKLTNSEREAAFLAAYRKSPSDALEATSWGGPQIMGFNYVVAGYPNVETMVRRMADDEDEHVVAFCGFVKGRNLVPALRQKNWERIAKVYNGSGRVKKYAALMARAYSGESASDKSIPTDRGASPDKPSHGLWQAIKALLVRFFGEGRPR